MTISSGLIPALLEGAAIAVALGVAWVLLRRSTTLGRAGAIVGLALAGVAAVCAWISFSVLAPRAEPPTNRPLAVARDGYLTSDGCRSCHPDQYGSWHDSYHRTMTQVADRSSVIPAFREVTTDAFGRRYRLFWKGAALWAEMDDPTWREVLVPAPRVELPIVMTTGSHHMQIFWYATQNGPLVGMLPVGYDIHDERWMPIETNFIMPPADPDLRKPLQVGQWNQRCIACHTTRPVPALVGPPETWQTRATELGIACEACHGPGAAHAHANQNPLRRYLLHLTGRPDDTIVNPARLSHDRSSEVCGRCHSIWNLPSNEELRRFRAEGDRFEPGGALEASGISMTRGRETNPEAFWSDGAVHAQGRELSAMGRSLCYTKGDLSCISCHQMHRESDDPRPLAEWRDDQLAPGMRGDGACLGCHARYAEDIAAHTHHEPESSGSRCVNCHMPHTALGARKASRNHEIDSPDVATELESGRPNACNLCHLDRTLAWTDRYLVSWYEATPTPLEAVHHEVPGILVQLLRGDAAQRAVAIWNLSWPEATAASEGEEWVPPFLAQMLVDPYHAVRYMAHRSLKRHPLYRGLRYDYLGSEAHRARVSGEVTDRWEEWRRSRGERPDLSVVLERAAGGEQPGVGPAVFTDLLDERDDRPIYINE